jgi:hypothetical protein
MPDTVHRLVCEATVDDAVDVELTFAPGIVVVRNRDFASPAERRAPRLIRERRRGRSRARCPIRSGAVRRPACRPS